MPKKKEIEIVDDNELNRRLMHEIGLEPGDNRYLVDQDTGDVLKFNDKFILSPGEQCSKESIPFDPVNNIKLMSRLFGHYAKKLEDMGEIDPINAYYPVPSQYEPNKGYMEVKDSSNRITKSNPYMNDSIKYADLICQMNGDTTVDLTKYDKSKEQASSIKRRSSKK